MTSPKPKLALATIVNSFSILFCGIFETSIIFVISAFKSSQLIFGKIFDIESASSDRLLLNNVSALEEDDQGRIWIGTAGGINVWDEKKQTMYAISANAENGLTSNYIAN